MRPHQQKTQIDTHSDKDNHSSLAFNPVFSGYNNKPKRYVQTSHYIRDNAG